MIKLIHHNDSIQYIKSSEKNEKNINVHKSTKTELS